MEHNRLRKIPMKKIAVKTKHTAIMTTDANIKGF